MKKRLAVFMTAVLLVSTELASYASETIRAGAGMTGQVQDDDRQDDGDNAVGAQGTYDAAGSSEDAGSDSSGKVSDDGSADNAGGEADNDSAGGEADDGSADNAGDEAGSVSDGNVGDTGAGSDSTGKTEEAGAGSGSVSGAIGADTGNISGDMGETGPGSVSGGDAGGTGPGSVSGGNAGTVSGNDGGSVSGGDGGTVSGGDAETGKIFDYVDYAGHVTPPDFQGNPAQVDVLIRSALCMGEKTFTVTLKGGQEEKSFPIVFEGSGETQEVQTVSFGNLPNGIYTLTVSAEGFAEYTQEIDVQGAMYTVTLETEKGTVYEGMSRHPGTLLIGDINADDRVDSRDKDLLVDMVFAGGYDKIADLNGDGAVNLADLEYFAKGYQVAGDISTIVSAIPPKAICPSEGANTKTEGELRNLLDKENSASVKLMPEGGGEISPFNPVALNLEVADGVGIQEIKIETSSENPVMKAEVYVVIGEEEEVIPLQVQASSLRELAESGVTATLDDAGNIRISLNGQIAVKRVILAITAVKNTNLAEISKVEFLNGMEERIPEPELDIPEGLKAEAGSKMISAKWEACVNVTGYEVMIETEGRAETYKVAGNSILLTSFGGKDLVNNTTYTVKVQSVNGAWRSGYCAEVEATPIPSDRPDKPDNVSASGGYRSIRVSWKAMEDAEFYHLYYKRSDAEEYIEVLNIEENGYIITGLEDLTEYMIYVVSGNRIGLSGPSFTVSAKTTDLEPPRIPKYRMINYSDEIGKVSEHIESAYMRAACKMIDSPLDEADTDARSAWGTVDNDPVSYYQTAGWDEGGYNTQAFGSGVGLTYTFDKAYKMDTIAIYSTTNFTYYNVRYWDENGNAALLNVSKETKQDSDGRSYIVLKFREPVTAKKIQIGIGAYLASYPPMCISEVYFYHYDELMDEIMALYEDALHTTLRPDVDQDMIDDLRVRINEKDEVSGEYNPNLAALERELETAEKILNHESLGKATVIHGGIHMDGGHGFSGLNAWQPIGVTAKAGEEVTIYVGHSSKTTGQAAELSLIATQYHAESGAMAKEICKLKVGENIVTIPKIWSIADSESGGALYVAYTGSNDSEQYAVRVGGGVKVPVLDLYKVADHNERIRLAEEYLKELGVYVDAMEENHGKYHDGFDYVQTNCILGASDILLDTMMLSLPAEQIWKGCGGSAEKLVASMDAMEDMMHLFYQHKGLNASAEDAADRIPKSHLNIRYQRMFSGAFMYAAGNHIGIEWGSAPGMLSSSGVVYDADGKYISGRYYGWGIAHEIGHNINDGAYAVAEITNNYFSVLAQAQDTNGSVRFSYKDVYKKVSSGTTGPASNVFTQLGMYWQLHLAYDKGYNYKTYENYDEQLANLFFARVDTYSRTPSKAPGSLTLSGDSNQKLMRLACAAAEKNILEFFERWGMIPDEGTIAYAKQFDKETRAIYYASDDARVYSLNGEGSVLGTQGTVEAVSDSASAAKSKDAANQVILTLGHNAKIPDADVLGYEILRCTVSGGEVCREPVGFATEETFTDTIVTMNNRTVYYEVTLIDKYLNRSAVKTLEPVKIEHEGDLDKTFWTVTTDNLTTAATDKEADEYMPCEAVENAWKALIDNNTATSYTATAGGNAEIVLEFNKTCTISGFRYQDVNMASGCGYEIQVLQEDTGWITAYTGTFSGSSDSGKIYFSHGDYVNTFAANAVKLVLKTAKGSQVTIGELDVLGVTGDNVDFRRTNDGTAAIGILSEDYRFGQGEKDVIPVGSIVFTGSFKGNPAYNVVMLFDQNGKMVGGSVKDEAGNGKAEQIILASEPAEGAEIQNVYDGTWIYWIAPDEDGQADTKALEKIEKVRAELYRVNDALTNGDQRLVSDSLYEEVPGTLPSISFDDNGNAR